MSSISQVMGKEKENWYLLIAGASLAQDRGRLESKIESQASEIVTLKKNLEVGEVL